MSNASSDTRRPRILIVGSGFGGVAAAIELLGHDLGSVTVLEAAAELGGTWHYNTYPGAACDVPGHLYSYSYAQRRDWTRLCSSQAEILHYLREVADAHGVTPLVRCGQRVRECRWSSETGEWVVETEAGETYVADSVIVAAGQLNRPAIPDLPGRETFAGHSFHSARWDHDYDLRGKRVAVVGTGASAIQLVPPVAEAAASLTVFQRTGNWMMPRTNRVYSPLNRWFVERIPGLQTLRRATTYVGVELLTRAIRHPRTIGRVAGLSSALFMRRQVPDPVLRAKLWPDYTFGCKRVLFSSHYLPVLSRPDVELVTEPLQEMTETGLRTSDGVQRDFDCVIWATGFRVSEFQAPMRVLGAGGVDLAEVWRDGAHAHLGMTVPGFPSLFFVYGPNTNSSGGSMIVYLEAQARYIRQAIAHLAGGTFQSLSVRPEVEAASDTAVQARFDGTAWVTCHSWYQDDRGRIVANWPGYMGEYVERTRVFDPGEYDFAP
jgi:cation diffusion facilitator CzcD-associated flavoprotein CzcO